MEITKTSDISETTEPKIKVMKKGSKWILFGAILLFSLCCIGYLFARQFSNRTIQNLYCQQIQPGMNREKVFSTIKQLGEFHTRKNGNSETAAYIISFNSLPKSILFGQAIIYFENDIYKGKVTYDSGGDFTPICEQ